MAIMRLLEVVLLLLTGLLGNYSTDVVKGELSNLYSLPSKFFYLSQIQRGEANLLPFLLSLNQSEPAKQLRAYHFAAFNKNSLSRPMLNLASLTFSNPEICGQTQTGTGN